MKGFSGSGIAYQTTYVMFIHIYNEIMEIEHIWHNKLVRKKDKPSYFAG